jgi:OOP family OmpA-OmpF porin
MKKIITVMLGAALTLCLSMPGFALVLTPDAAKMLRKNITAYSPDTFDGILKAQGLTLKPEVVKTPEIPSSYATAKDGKVVFGKKSMAYSPDVLHVILTSYGLTLSPEAVKAKMGSTNYAKVKDGKIVFSKVSTAYGGETLKSILEAYEMPAVAKAEPAPMPAAPVPPPPTPKGPVDSDKDGVTDDRDKCPGTPEGARVDERGCWVVDIQFDFDKSVVKPKYDPVLKQIADILKKHPEVKSVRVDGHTDSTGTEKYNQKLSERRAKAVKDHLIKKGGISASRLKSKGYGESQPIAPNTTKEGQAKNRRVELTRDDIK